MFTTGIARSLGLSLAVLALVAVTGCSGNPAVSGQPAAPDERAGLAAEGDVLTRSQIDRINASRMVELFEGRFAGVQVLSSRGAPRLVMRGEADPLIVIDGVPQADVQSLWSLNPRDIEEIRVVKDAATAIYGVRGGRGVVEVRTRFR